LVEKAKRYSLDVVGISSTKRCGSNTVGPDNGWKLFYSGVEPTQLAQAAEGVLVSSQLASCVDESILLGGWVCMLRLKLLGCRLYLIQAYSQGRIKGGGNGGNCPGPSALRGPRDDIHLF